MNTLNLKSLLDIQLAVKKPPEIPEFDNKQDYILLSLTMMSTFIAKTLPYLTAASLPATNKKVSKEKIGKKLALDLGNMLQFLFMFVDVCHYDLPDEIDIEDYLIDAVPVEFKVDPVLAVMNMIGCVSNLMSFTYLASEKPLWEYNEMPKDLEEDIYDLVACLFAVCNKYGLSFDDLATVSYEE